MDATSQEELNSVQIAGSAAQSDSVVHWQSAFGLIIIETRGDQVFVNGDPVRPANLRAEKDGS